MANVTIRYWAAAKEAAKIAEENISADTLAGALDVIRNKRADDSRFAAILARSSFLIDGAPAGRRVTETIMLPEGAVVEVLPAFAGG